VLPTFAVDLRTAFIVERPSATIHVRWSTEVDDDGRASLERQLGLAADARLDAATWRYRVNDLSASALERIVRHRSVDDTLGIDRMTYAIDGERREGSCLVCLAAGPGLHARANAQAWLYYFAWFTAAAGIIVSSTRGLAAAPVVGALTVMTALASSTFLRSPLPVRLADVWGLVPLLLGIAIARGWMASRWRLPLRAAIVTMLLVTAAAVMIAGNAEEEFTVARVREGPAAMADRLKSVTNALAASWPAAAVQPGPNEQPVVGYLAACSRPTDRILVFSFAPQLYYLSTRGFAAGYSSFVIGAHDSRDAQGLGVLRWRAQSVPYAVMYEGETELHEAFPLIAAEIERRYTPVFRQPLADDRVAIVVLAERGRMPLGTYEPLQAPCLA
jgi:hypothetical protein